MITVANEIWIATALLHREHPEREDFAVAEIIDRARRESLIRGFRPGVYPHVSTHIVASKPPNPGRLRLLHESTRGRRRLYRTGDPFHPDRSGSKTHPGPEELPPKYAALVDWYTCEYDRTPGGTPIPPPGAMSASKSLHQTPSGNLLAPFFGILRGKEGEELERAMEDLEKVNLNEW